MLNNPPDVAIKARLRNPKVARIAAFLAQEEAGLVDLLENLGEFEAVDAVRNATRLAAAQTPDLEGLGHELVHILDGLDSIPLAVVDQMMFAGLGPRDAHAAIRWAGARLSDLLGLLKAA